MTEFLPVELDDSSWIKPLVYSENNRNADFSFTNIYAWAEAYGVKAAKINGCLIVRMTIDGYTAYSFPVGTDNPDTVKSTVEFVLSYAKERCEKFRLQSLAPEKIPLLESLFPGYFDFFPDSNYFDYIYLADKLVSLSGKKLHAKRNYINRFTSEYNWSFEVIDTGNIAECMMMDGLWVYQKDSDLDLISHEITALKRTMSNYNDLGLDGGLLRIDGKVCAFTVGERLSSDTYVVHFEKALPEITGSYPMINREFVRYIREKYPEIVYINREDDMGLENLRKAKRSYYPEFLLEKYLAIPKL